MKNINSSSYTKWNYRYHIVFVLKYKKNLWVEEIRNRKKLRELRKCNDYRCMFKLCL